MMTHEQKLRMMAAIKDSLVACSEAVREFGAEAQLDMMIEECAELTQAICHTRRCRPANVAEEVADVIIVAMQVAEIVGPDDVINAIYEKCVLLHRRISAYREARTP